jgi:beta-phosphoglucomutase-like phosphatase (HAD superfamily)
VPKAVIFDMDGTLVDSVDLHADSWARTFAHFGRYIPVEKVRFQIGKGSDQLLPDLLGQEDADARGEEMAAYRADLFKREYISRVKPFPGVPDLFRHIREQGLKIAIASSAKADELKVYKKIGGVEGLTDVDTTSEDVEKSKPHPDIFQTALKKLGLLPPPQRLAWARLGCSVVGSPKMFCSVLALSRSIATRPIFSPTTTRHLWRNSGSQRDRRLE